ncbi:MAG: Dabb family protein [Bacillota bacterium]|jgi:hypothetical protein
MIKHIVMWQLKEEAHGNPKAANARIIKEKLEALNGRIPGLLKLEVGINCVPEPGGSDVVLYSEFATRQDLDNYQSHPEHLAAASFVRAVNVERRVVDYEVG